MGSCSSLRCWSAATTTASRAGEPRVSSPRPATAPTYCALVKCACCLRSFAENDVRAFGFLQRARGSRLRRCLACDGVGDSALFDLLIEVNRADGVVDRLQAAGMDIVRTSSGGRNEYELESRKERAQWVEAVQATSLVYREVFGAHYSRAWLQHDVPADDLLYTPQLGDDVVYFPEAYNSFVLKFAAARELTCRPNYWTDTRRVLIDRSFAVKCRVVDVRYVFPSVDRYDKCRIVMVEITLAVLAVPPKEEASRKRKQQEANSPAHMFDAVEPAFGQFVAVDSTMAMLRRESLASKRHQMKVVCHPTRIEDYLVLDAKFEIGVRSRWNVGDRVESPMINLDADSEPMNAQRFVGTIVSTDPVPVAYYNTVMDVMTPAVSFKVKWDGQEEAAASGAWQGLQGVSS